MAKFQINWTKIDKAIAMCAISHYQTPMLYMYMYYCESYFLNFKKKTIQEKNCFGLLVKSALLKQDPLPYRVATTQSTAWLLLGIGVEWWGCKWGSVSSSSSLMSTTAVKGNVYA